ncbi:MAG: hypothetical protein JNJ73_10230 [Hyphomonadaceae bacterium]|nr:hypothetical protein [Hyphomonadaceae bacterium]
MSPLARLALVWLIPAILGCLAQPASAEAPLFASDAPLAMVIEGPIVALDRAGPRSTIARPATLVLHADGAEQSFAIAISPRGVSRRDPRVCDFPPLTLDFDEGAVAGTIFEGQDKLKLVTHCRREARFAHLPRLEYLAYRFYELLTPLSFKVRPVAITYREAGRDAAGGERFGFLIEDIDDVARRNGRREISAGSAEIPVERFDPQQTSLLALFQYMIGNLDWDYRYGPVGADCCHNIKLIARAGQSAGIVPVPYDFDFSGFVDAPYAVPPSQVRVQSVRTRFFRGRCRHRDELLAAAAPFRTHRAAMLALLDSAPDMNAAARLRARSYLDEFFALLDDPARFDAELVRRCIR